MKSIQLSLFTKVTIIYWSQPYNKHGYKQKYWQLYTEEREYDDWFIEYYKRNPTEYKILTIQNQQQ